MGERQLYTLPLKVRRVAEAFIVEESNGVRLAYVYFDDTPAPAGVLGRPSREAAKTIAQRIARALTDGA